MLQLQYAINMRYGYVTNRTRSRFDTVPYELRMEMLCPPDKFVKPFSFLNEFMTRMLMHSIILYS